jgi:hypothetical protein
MIKNGFPAAAVLFLFALTAYAGFQLQDWQYTRTVQPAKDGFVLIDLDPDVLTHARDDLADIRLTAADGRKAPYQIAGMEPARAETYPVRLIDRVTQPGEYLSVTMDLQNSGRLHDRITLDLESKEDYLRDVTIEGSDDNRTWKLIARDKVLSVASDYRKNNYRKNDLAYNPASFRYVRLLINDGGKEPLTLKGARITFVPPAGERPLPELPVTLVSNRTDQKTNKTDLVIDLGAGGYQVSEIGLQVSGKNFQRNVEYSDSSDGTNWERIGSDRIYQYQWPDYETLKNRLTLNRGFGPRYIKLTIDNQDSPPLDVQKITVWGVPPRLLADLRAESYNLWYGNKNSSRPQYDLSQFSHLIDKNKLESIKPGSENRNAGYRFFIFKGNLKGVGFS